MGEKEQNGALGYNRCLSYNHLGSGHYLLRILALIG